MSGFLRIIFEFSGVLLNDKNLLFFIKLIFIRYSIRRILIITLSVKKLRRKQVERQKLVLTDEEYLKLSFSL